MASPRRIYRIYLAVAQDAVELNEFLIAKGEKSGTVALLAAGERATFLRRFGEEMAELCGVLDGTHEDPYLMEASQCFYWASLYGASGRVSWDELGFQDLREAAARSGIESPSELAGASARLAALPVEQAKAAKLFLLWHVADRLYRKKTALDQQFTVEQIMEADLQEMRKKPYLQTLLRTIGE